MLLLTPFCYPLWDTENIKRPRVSLERAGCELRGTAGWVQLCCKLLIRLRLPSPLGQCRYMYSIMIGRLNACRELYKVRQMHFSQLQDCTLSHTYTAKCCVAPSCCWVSVVDKWGLRVGWGNNSVTLSTSCPDIFHLTGAVDHDMSACQVAWLMHRRSLTIT
jgi:hypothetical protein